MALSESSNESGGYLVHPARLRTVELPDRHVMPHKYHDHRGKTKRKPVR